MAETRTIRATKFPMGGTLWHPWQSLPETGIYWNGPGGRLYLMTMPTSVNGTATVIDHHGSNDAYDTEYDAAMAMARFVRACGDIR